VPLSNGPPGEHLDKRLATEAAKWMATQKDRPFLLWMSFYDVHIPLMAPAETIAYFEAKKKRMGLEDAFADEGKSRVRTVQCHTTYAAMIKTMDDCVGMLIKQLEAQHQLDNTIIVFTSDNGGLATAEGTPTSNLPLRGGKGWSYEGGTRVPMLVIAPGYTHAGTHSDEPAISMDLYPTLLSAAGVPRPDNVQVDGIDLVPALAGMPDHRPGRPLFWHYPHYGNQGGSPFSSVRLGDYKLIEFHDPRQGTELYNLANDPSEKQNIAADHPDEVKSLHDKLAAWKKEVGAIDASKQ
jgi:arylsulfatase A-like enzyme